MGGGLDVEDLWPLVRTRPDGHPWLREASGAWEAGLLGAYVRVFEFELLGYRVRQEWTVRPPGYGPRPGGFDQAVVDGLARLRSERGAEASAEGGERLRFDVEDLCEHVVGSFDPALGLEVLASLNRVYDTGVRLAVEAENEEWRGCQEGGYRWIRNINVSMPDRRTAAGAVVEVVFGDP